MFSSFRWTRLINKQHGSALAYWPAGVSLDPGEILELEIYFRDYLIQWTSSGDAICKFLFTTDSKHSVLQEINRLIFKKSMFSYLLNKISKWINLQLSSQKNNKTDFASLHRILPFVECSRFQINTIKP